MNERLRELVRQAGLDDADFPIEDWDNVPLAKFAELLLLECIELVETTPRHCAFTTHDLPIVECTIQKSSERLHEHFGIQRTFKTTDERTSTKEIPNARRSL